MGEVKIFGESLKKGDPLSLSYGYFISLKALSSYKAHYAKAYSSA